MTYGSVVPQSGLVDIKKDFGICVEADTSQTSVVRMDGQLVGQVHGKRDDGVLPAVTPNTARFVQNQDDVDLSTCCRK